ncbi:DUF2842 domain-containing protein [Stappia sp.]|uniref:DUF2842 domain-containing protein n=1 Tax=Stappia sp. TaxID=1870903 RepID=UPI0032D8CCE7
MPLRLRKFVGMVVMVVFVIVYAFVAMVIGDLTMQDAGTGLQMLYFAIAGLAWTIPVGALMWWMDKPVREANRLKRKTTAE